MNYVVLCQPRTGSTYLTRLLRSHPGVVSHGELFEPHAIYWADRPAEKEAAALAARDADPVAFLRQVHDSAPPGLPVGFKIFPHHSPPILEHVRASPAMPRIRLRRDNLLAQFSSGLIAEATGVFTQTRRHRRIRVPFDEAEFLRFVERASIEATLLDDVARPVSAVEPRPRILDLEYRDLFARDIDQRLTSFLDVAPSALRAEQLVRQNTGDIVHRFHHPAGVRAFLERFGRPDWAAERIGGG